MCVDVTVVVFLLHPIIWDVEWQPRLFQHDRYEITGDDGHHEVIAILRHVSIASHHDVFVGTFLSFRNEVDRVQYGI